MSDHSNSFRLIYNVDNLPQIPATLEEDDSYYVYNTYPVIHSSHITYSYPGISYDIVKTIANDFCLFSGKVKESESSPQIHSFFPIGVIRYMLHDDLTFSNYYTPRRREGWVVEGMYWTNGFVYQIRDDSDSFTVHQLTISLDQVSSKLMNLKDPSQYVNI